MLLALVRVRKPGTVGVPLSALCRVLLSTAFMLSCSAASSAHWIPWDWLSCVSDVAPPNLPPCTEDNTRVEYVTVYEKEIDTAGSHKDALTFNKKNHGSSRISDLSYRLNVTNDTPQFSDYDHNN